MDWYTTEGRDQKNAVAMNYMSVDCVHVSPGAIPHNIFQVCNLLLVYIVVLVSLFDCSFKQSLVTWRV